MASPNSKSNGIGKDIVALLILAFSIFVLLSLFSYDVRDPTMFHATGMSVYHNMAGRIGANLSDLLRLIFGWSGYLVGIAGIMVFFAVLLKDRWEHRWTHVTGLLILIVSLSFTVTAIVSRTPVSVHKEVSMFQSASLRNPGPGGVIGYLLTLKLHPYIGNTGTIMVAVTLMLIAVVLLIRRPITHLFALSMGFVAGAVKRLGTGILVWREKQRRIRERLGIKDKEHDIVIQPPKKGPEPLPKEEHRAPEPVQEELFKAVPGEFKKPSLTLLDDYEARDIEYDTGTLQFNARTLEKKLADFNVNGKVTNIRPGPVITMYEFEPAPGVKVSQIMNLSDDLALAMKVPSVRIQAHVVDKSAVGIEVPNASRRIVYLKEVFQSKRFRESSSMLTVCLGVDTTGEPVVADLAKMPHLLIGGSTNSGKSVTMNAIIMSLLFKATPDELKFILVDPKMLEFSPYNDIPHLLHEVITEPKKATSVLRWVTEEMDRRYSTINRAGARNISVYNQMVRSQKLDDAEAIELPKIVLIIDELSDLMFTAPKEVEEYIIRLSQKARAAGIHIIFATQRPSVDVITGTIKSNFSSRIALKVPQKTDSRIILDQSGAEELLGAGDMLFIPPGGSQPVRVHGVYVSDAEVVRVTEYLKKTRKPAYEIRIEEQQEQDNAADDGLADELYGKALEIIKESGSASISLIQRRLRVGYNRAARMVEKMEKDGIISRPDSANKNTIVSK